MVGLWPHAAVILSLSPDHPVNIYHADYFFIILFDNYKMWK
jgi:hypothetical protein